LDIFGFLVFEVFEFFDKHPLAIRLQSPTFAFQRHLSQLISNFFGSKFTLAQNSNLNVSIYFFSRYLYRETVTTTTSTQSVTKCGGAITKSASNENTKNQPLTLLCAATTSPSSQTISTLTSPLNDTDFYVCLLKYFMSLVVGVACSFWVCGTRKAYTAWRTLIARLFFASRKSTHNCCGKAAGGKLKRQLTATTTTTNTTTNTDLVKNTSKNNKNSNSNSRLSSLSDSSGDSSSSSEEEEANYTANTNSNNGGGSKKSSSISSKTKSKRGKGETGYVYQPAVLSHNQQLDYQLHHQQHIFNSCHNNGGVMLQQTMQPGPYSHLHSLGNNFSQQQHQQMQNYYNHTNSSNSMGSMSNEPAAAVVSVNEALHNVYAYPATLFRNNPSLPVAASYFIVNESGEMQQHQQSHQYHQQNKLVKVPPVTLARTALMNQNAPNVKLSDGNGSGSTRVVVLEEAEYSSLVAAAVSATATSG
jgi:hypothetical protein